MWHGHSALCSCFVGRKGPGVCMSGPFSSGELPDLLLLTVTVLYFLNMCLLLGICVCVRSDELR